MIETVEVEATYNRPKQVPRIGQRKAMRVNGKVQLMTLNSLVATREHGWGTDGIRHVWWFSTKETWGTFYAPAK